MKNKLNTTFALSAALMLCTLVTYAEAITLMPTTCIPLPACENGAEILNNGGGGTSHTFPPISFTFTPAGPE